jgi:Uma2 family endonuclease
MARWTRPEVLALPDDGNRYELFDGELVVTPSPARRHQARAGSWADTPLPLLAIEVLSPSTARYDRGLKRRIYQRAGILEFWIVDLEAPTGNSTGNPIPPSHR